MAWDRSGSELHNLKMVGYRKEEDDGGGDGHFARDTYGMRTGCARDALRMVQV